MADPSAGRIAGIVLAAGRSTRLGRPKQLLDIGGKALIAHVVECALASSLDCVVVVTGHEANAVRDALATLDVTIAHNPRFAEGQSTSLLAGVAAASAADAVVILLGDQPGIDPATIDRLVAARRDGDALVAMADYGGRQGHPVLFGRELFGELSMVTGDEGGRSVIRRRQADLVLVDGGTDEPPPDIDSEADYALLAGKRGLW